MSDTEQVAGPAFPFAIDPQTGGVAWARGRDKIRQNLRVLLGTRVGERPMQRNFGARLPSLVHDVNSAVLAQIAITQAQEAVLQWEPRVLVTDAQVEQREGELKLILRYAFIAEQKNDELALQLT
jgi:phage baseplate assembly protein W